MNELVWKRGTEGTTPWSSLCLNLLTGRVGSTQFYRTLRGHGDAAWALQNRKGGATGPPKRTDWVALAEQVAAIDGVLVLDGNVRRRRRQRRFRRLLKCSSRWR